MACIYNIPIDHTYTHTFLCLLNYIDMHIVHALGYKSLKVSTLEDIRQMPRGHFFRHT